MFTIKVERMGPPGRCPLTPRFPLRARSVSDGDIRAAVACPVANAPGSEEGNRYTVLIGPKPLQTLAYRGMADRKAGLPERVHNQSSRVAIRFGKEGSIQRSGRPKGRGRLIPSPRAE